MREPDPACRLRLSLPGGPTLRLALVLLGLSVLASPAAAQKTCRKGKPCGNTCIGKTKTCHIESTLTPKVTPTQALPH